MGHRVAEHIFTSIQISRDLYEGSEKPLRHEEIRSSRKLLRLSEKEFKYLELKNGLEEKPIPDEWGYRPHELEDQIEGKLELLPYRVRLLADDIRALDQYDLFDSDRWSIHLDELGFQASQSALSTISYNDGIDQYEFGSIGEMFGLLSHRITQAANNDTGDEVDLILGFIEGLLFAHNIDAHSRTRKSTIPSLLEVLETRSEEFIERSASQERDADEWYRNRTEEREHDLRYLSDIIDKYDIAPEQSSKHIASFVKSRLELKRSSECQDDISIPNDVTAKDVIEAVIDGQLVEERQFRNISHEHWKRLNQKSARGPDPIDILQLLDENGDSSSREIANELSKKEGNSRDWTAGVTESARDLAGQRSTDEYPRREIWNDHPLLNGDSHNWSLTPFGKALVEYQHAHENQKSPSLHSLPSEIMEELISEFNLPHGMYVEVE